MGNRVSTSQTAFSLEELESLARAPPLLDSLPAELQQHGTTTSTTSSTASSSPHRKEALKAELERLYTDYDTSLHALRCVFDRTGTRHQQRSSSQAPVSTAPATRSGRSRSATKVLGSHGRKPAGDAGPLSSQRSRDRRSGTQRGDGSSDALDKAADASDAAGREGAATGAAASSSSGATAAAPRQERRRAASRGPTLAAASRPASDEASLSPRSWIFREVSVQPVDLSRATEVKPSEVYVLVIVQRVNLNTTSSSSNGTTPATTSINTAAASAGAGGLAGGSAGVSGSANQEWPRDMVHVFSPRGLTTSFSTDMTRPTLMSGVTGAGVGAGAGGWYSPSATPRTNGSTSNRPTPRSTPVGAFNANTSAAGYPQASPRSMSSQPTPRNTGFHFSVHLLTGKQANSMTAAAGLCTARAVEKLFLDNPDFDRRLFYNVSADRTEAMIKAYSLHASPEAPSVRRAGDSSGATASGKSARSSSRAAAAGTDASGVAGGRSGTSSGVAGTSLHHLSASLEAWRELRRELLAVLRPAAVVAPRFDKRGASVASPGGGGEHAMPVTSVSSNTAELYSVNAVYRVLNGVRLGTPRWMHYGELVSPLTSARYSMPGAAGSGPGGSSGGGAGGGVAGVATGGGTLGWHHDPLPVFRPPPPPPPWRSGTVDAGASSPLGGHGTVTSVPALNFSSWLQGPQPLDVHRAASAAAGTSTHAATGTAATASAASAGGSGSGGGTTTPRIGRPPRRAWTPSSTTTSAAVAPTASTTTHINASATAGMSNVAHTLPSAPLPLPTLPLGALSGASAERRVGAGTPPDAAAAAASAAPPSLSPRSSLSAPSPSPQGTGPSTSAAAAPGSTGFSLSLPLGALRQQVTSGSSGVAAGAAPATGGASSMRSAPRTTPSTASSLGTSAGTSERAPAERPALSALPIPMLPSVSHQQHYHGHQRVDSQAAESEAASAGEPDKVPGDRGGDGGSDVATDDADEFNEVHTQQERAQRLKAAQPDVTEVLPYLFVGGEDAARDRAQLLRKGVTHVVNTVFGCLDNFHPDLFRYCTLSLSDAADEPIFSLFALVNAFIEEAVERHHGRVFVHCQQGVSRSCTFIMAYVMWKQGLCYDRAYELVRARRNVCSPNLGFLMNLRLWEAQLSTPLLNAVYAFAPYTASAPLPLSYQLVAYFDSTTSSTAAVPTTTTTTSTSSSTVAGTAEADVAAPALLTDSTGSPASASASTTATASPAPLPSGTTPPAEKEAHLQLRSDVLTRAVNMTPSSGSGSGSGTASAAETLPLDPRLAYLFLFAPTRRISTSTANASTAAAATAASNNPNLSKCGSAEGGVITGCVVVGAKCLNVAYTTQALAACHKFVRFSFYHGAPAASRTDAGRVLHFNPLRPVRLLLPPSPRVSPASLAAARYTAMPSHATTATAPVAAVSPEEAQRQLAAHLGSRAAARVAVTPQRQWDVFFAPAVRLGATLTQHIADEARLEATEATRRHARTAALKELLDLAATARSGPTASGSRPASRSGPGAGPVPQLPSPLPPTHPHHPSSGASSPSFRTGRHTPRTPRHATSTTGSGGGASSTAAAAPGTSFSLSGNGGNTSLPLPPHAASAAPAAGVGDGPAAAEAGAQPTAHPQRLLLQPVTPLATAAGPASLSLSSASLSAAAAATATEAPAAASGSGAARRGSSTAAVLPTLPLKFATQPQPPHHHHRAGAHSGAEGGGGSNGSRRANTATVSPVTVSLAAGESFAYAFPFTADAKVVITDLDDLDDGQCYALGFQERTGTSVYLWRGTQAAEETADVVRAFALNMLCETDGSADPAGEAALTADAAVAALESREWCTCFIHLPELAARGRDGGAAAAAQAIMRVRVLYVDEGEEPKEFFTLL